MKYTVRYAHLLEPPVLKVGDIVLSGDTIGKMGSTGQSTGPHVHIDCAEGKLPILYTLKDMEDGLIKPSPRQLNWFIDGSLFLAPIVITTYYCEPQYMRDFKKLHFGYDVIPLRGGSGSPIYWNRSMPGKVISVVKHEHYGNMIQVCFEAG